MAEHPRARPLARLTVLALAGALTLALAGGGAVGAAAATPTVVPNFSHVVEVMLENESATSTFENASDTALQNLRKLGVYLPNFFGVGHNSLTDYEAAFGAVEPTANSQGDCPTTYDQCVLGAPYPTFGPMLDDKGAGRTWKVYAEGMNTAATILPASASSSGPCLHPYNAVLGRTIRDPYQGPNSYGYATRHNPAVWFDSVLTRGGSEAYCQAHVVDLAQLTTDLRSSGSLPSYSFVVPDSCHDGHDTPCGAPESPTPSGVAAVDAWLPGFVKQVTSAPGWDANSLLVITFDESAATETAGCTPCGDKSAGGRVGALLIGGPVAQPGSTYGAWSGDHYSMLRTWETAWGLPTLKSLAGAGVDPAKLHDGDPGVTPLTGIWATPTGSAGPAGGPGGPYGPYPGTGGTVPNKAVCRPGAVRIVLPPGRWRAATAYLGSRRVALARGRSIRAVRFVRPPGRSFTLRLVLTPGRGRRVAYRVTVRRTTPRTGGCTLRAGRPARLRR